MPGFSLHQVTKTYPSRGAEPVTAVQDVTLTVPEGQVLGLLGHNGAGKSTIVKLLLGLTRPDQGSLLIGGRPVTGEPAVRRQVGYLPEVAGLYPYLTGFQLLQFFARLRGARDLPLDDWVERFGLGDAIDRPVGTYSKGMRQRLGLIQAFMHEPDLIILDEPFNGLDPAGVQLTLTTVAEAKARGATIILTSHILPEIQHAVDVVAFMAHGRLLAHGSPEALATRYAIPTRIHIEAPGPIQARLLEEIGSFAGRAVREGSRLILECHGTEKMTVLVALARLDESAVSGVSVQEPTLTDIYLAASQQQEVKPA
ncbi:MAG: ABC transporter ATP-binding protein [Firmicutes bacterium]|nr:ABC transporter ATP-binding protein [Bacillota bacterium]